MVRIVKRYYFLIVPLAVTLLMLLGKIHLAQVDDSFMMEIANSFKTNSHSEHLVFINVYYGYFIKFLYNLIPNVNWFAILYLAIINIAFITMHKITQNYENKLIFVGILAIMQAVIYYYITFTVMPFICSAAAILWALEYVKKVDKHSIKHILFSFVLYFLGFGMRSASAFTCIFLMFLPIYLFSVIKKENSIWAIVVIMSICFVANYSVTYIKNEYNKTIPEDTYFIQFAQYRAELSDGEKIDYEKNREAFEAIGITSNDMAMYRSYEYADKNVFSNENLKKITQMRSFFDKYTFNIFEFEISFQVLAVMLTYLFVALISFILFKNRRREILLFSVFVFGAILFLFIRKRALLRVVLPIVITGLIMLSYYGMQELTKNIKVSHKLRNVGIILIAIIFVGVNVYNAYNNMRYNNASNKAKKVVEYVQQNHEKTYLTDERFRLYASPRALSLKTLENSSPQPYDIFGDWYVYSYFWYNQLDELRLSQYQDCTFKAVLEDRVRVITNQPAMLDRICIFLKEHYDIESNYQLEEKIADTSYISYKFSVVD